MRLIYSADLSFNLLKHIAKNKIKKNRFYPFVLMLEPTLRCNLSCFGCGRIKEYKDVLSKNLSVEDCLDAARQAGAPIVTVTGGEPLIYPEIEELLDSLLGRGHFIYLCTNGLLLEDFVSGIKPNKRLSIVVHLDALAETHDKYARKKGVFSSAVQGIKKAKKLGFKIRTNTTIYKNSDIDEVGQLLNLLKGLGVDGAMISPAYSYEVIDESEFLSKEEIISSFEGLRQKTDGIRLYNTPLYWDFLTGKRQMQCIPWSTPTYNVKGWRSPCYLMADKHYPDFKTMIEKTDWSSYGKDKDPRCRNCMAHCGYEASSIQINNNLKDLIRLARWNIMGRN